jgi:hypothetical protein
MFVVRAKIRAQWRFVDERSILVLSVTVEYVF